MLRLIVIVAVLISMNSFANPAQNTKTPPTDNNSKESKTFLEDNKKNPGVTTLESGLQYKVVHEGKGKKPSPNGFVSVKYKGSLPNGVVFDQSTQEPVTFAINSVIPGWQEALPLMNEGATWIIYVPSNLAYGERGVGRLIGPNQALVFEIELVKVEDSLEEQHKDSKQEAWEDGD